MAESKITKLIYDMKLEDFARRLEELQNPSIVYVSDMVYCPLKRRFRLAFPHLTFEFEPIAIMGELVHRGLQAILAERGYQVEYEVSREYALDNNVYLVKGRVDAYGHNEVIEIKTSRGLADALPYQHHLLQVKAYLELTGAERGVLLYVSPDKIYEYQITLEEKVVERLLDETLRAVSAPRWDWECRSCAFVKICPRRLVK